MLFQTRRRLMFAALCALVLLSLPAKYGRAESNAADRPERPSTPMQNNDREADGPPPASVRGGTRAADAAADVTANQPYKNEDHRGIAGSGVFPGAMGGSPGHWAAVTAADAF